MTMKRMCVTERSSNVQLEGLEFAANGVASWTPWCSAASVFADEDVNAFLAQAADAFGTCIAVPQIRELSTGSTIDLNRIGKGRRRVGETL